MKVIYTWLAIILLFFSSAGAFYGSYHLYGHPDGSSLKLPLDLLKHTPFKNFKIPGILLFVSVGMVGALAIVMTILQISYHAKYIIAAGLILTVWMLVQMVFTAEIYRLQYIVLAIGIAELLCGIALDRDEKPTYK